MFILQMWVPWCRYSVSHHINRDVVLYKLVLLILTRKRVSSICWYASTWTFLQFRTEHGLWQYFGTVLPAKIRCWRKGLPMLAWRTSIQDSVKKRDHCSLFEVHIINKISVAMCLHHDSRFRVRFSNILNPCGHNSTVGNRAWKISSIELLSWQIQDWCPKQS